MASVDAQVTGLVARVAVVTPDEASRTAIGRNVLDPAARAPSAEAGRAQAKAEAERVAEAWTGWVSGPQPAGERRPHLPARLR